MKWPIMTILLAVCIIAGLAGFWFFSSRTTTSTVTIDGRVTYKVDVAESTVAKAKGLSGRASLASDAGMLFIFGDDAVRYFWMQGMLIPLDVVWIRDGRIIGLQANIPHPEANKGQIMSFQSPEAADMVLELNAGDIAKQGLAIGQAVSIDKISDSR